MFTYEIIRTSKDAGERLSQVEVGKTVKSKTYEPGETSRWLNILPDEKYQSIIGFGGAFTEAAAVTLNKLSQANQEKVVRAYFSQTEGHAYNMGRVHIHSCDFALGNYTYVDDMDEDLKTFSIEHDKAQIIPFIKRAQATRGQAISLLASPWSPPAWMKTNGQMNNGGSLLDKYQGTWAKYYSKFLSAYKAEGLSMWGVTVQNEPAAVQVWDSCIYSAEQERDFVKNHLGPRLHKDGHDDVRILVWDHNRDIIVERVAPIYKDEEAAKYVWGAGIHWYVSEAFENVGQVHKNWPDKHLLFTEGCQEGGVQIGKWYTGERYGRNIIGDFNNWNEGFLDWNLLLDETGGPNHVNNLCDAPIIGDTKNDEVIFNASYYYIGHFSRYVLKDAVRIGLAGDCKINQAVAFQNPDGTYVLVIMNESDNDVTWTVGFGDERIRAELRPHSIVTIKLIQE